MLNQSVFPWGNFIVGAAEFVARVDRALTSPEATNIAVGIGHTAERVQRALQSPEAKRIFETGLQAIGRLYQWAEANPQVVAGFLEAAKTPSPDPNWGSLTPHHAPVPRGDHPRHDHDSPADVIHRQRGRGNN